MMSVLLVSSVLFHGMPIGPSDEARLVSAGGAISPDGTAIFIQSKDVSRSPLRLGVFQKVTKVNLFRSSFSPDLVKEVSLLPNLEILVLCESNATDEHLKQLQGASKLKRLELRETSVSDRGLKVISTLSDLRVLDITLTSSKGAFISDLGNSNIEELVANKLPLTESNFDHIGKLKKLKRLQLRTTGISGSALVNSASRIEGLSHLDVGYSRISDEDLKKLSAMRNLNHLDVEGTVVSDIGVAYLSTNASLESLSLDSTKVTDAVATSILAMKNLKEVSLCSTDISIDGLNSSPAKRQ